MTAEGLERALFIEFECLAQKPPEPPRPALLGVLVGSEGEELEQIITDERLAPAHVARRERTRVVAAPDAVGTLVAMAAADDRPIAGWSYFDRDRLIEACPSLAGDINARYVNALKVARPWRKAIYPDFPIEREDQYSPKLITAWNPASVVLSRKENDKRQAELRRLVSEDGYVALDGKGHRRGSIVGARREPADPRHQSRGGRAARATVRPTRHRHRPARIRVAPGADEYPESMKVLADISIIPLGVGVSLSKYVAACERLLRNAGLDPHLHAFGTEVEGDWDVVTAALRRCHETLHEMGAPRVSTTVKLSTRVDRDQTLEDKVRSVRGQI